LIIWLITQNRLFSLVIWYLNVLINSWIILLTINLIIYCILIFYCSTIYWVSIFILNWITCSSMSSLFSQFSLSYSFRNWRWIWMTSRYRIWKYTWTCIIYIIWIEKLSGHHHLLLLIIILISSGSFPLIDKIEQVSLITINTILITNTTSCSYSIITYSTCSSLWTHSTRTISSIYTNRAYFILILLLNTTKNCMTRITLP